MSSEEAAAPTKTGTDDDGMSWWYRWICKLAGVLGGICEYHTWLWLSYGCLISIVFPLPDRQVCPCVMLSETFPTKILSYTQHSQHVMCWTSSVFTSLTIAYQNKQRWCQAVQSDITSLEAKLYKRGFQSFRCKDPQIWSAMCEGPQFKRQHLTYKASIYTVKNHYKYVWNIIKNYI